MYNLKNTITFKKNTAILVYIAIALLAISDSGIQLLILHLIGPYSRTLRLIAMSFLFVKLLLTRYNKKQFFILLPISVLSLYNYTLSGNIYCIYNILIIACLKDVDYSTLFKVLFYSTLLTISCLGILSCFGIGGPMQLTQNFGRDIVETRYCFGLYHPNIWHQAIARCIVFFCIGYYHKINFIHLSILFAINYFIYKLSISRTGLLAVSIFLFLIFLYKYLNKFMQCIFVKISAFSGMLAIYVVYLYYTYDYATNFTLASQLFNYRLTTGRIQQAVAFLQTAPIKLLGSRFPDDGTLFDCGFLRIFYESGYLLAGIFFIALFILVFCALRNNWDVIIPACVFFIFYSLYEIDPVTRPTFNVIVYFLALLLYKPSVVATNPFSSSFQKAESLKS